MADLTLDQFVSLSAALTGIAAEKLHPEVDTHKTAQEYLDYLTQNAPDQVATLVTALAANPGLSGDELAAAILEQSGSAVAACAQSVSLMWYLGAYYAPADLLAYKSNGTPPPFIVVSADAYTQGWSWRVAQAHPMGYSDLRFGYWNKPPPPLSAFVEAQA